MFWIAERATPYGIFGSKKSNKEKDNQTAWHIQGQPVQSSIHRSASQGRNGICLLVSWPAAVVSLLTGAYCIPSLLTGAAFWTGSSLFLGHPVHSSIHRSASQGMNSICRLSGRFSARLLSSGVTAGVAPLVMISFQLSAVVWSRVPNASIWA